jgi:lysophospholipid acyltransferase (LPLAT)-like uncharacterized protein|tara:strand:+ start:840 stop:1511 length:672 start_codon:yes stop_codon:yes gene_type:complete
VLSYKKILRTKLAYSVICWVGAKYIKFVSFTNSWSFINKKYVENLWKKNEAFILCFWHGRLLMMPLSWNKEKKINVLISTHSDGQLLSKTVKHFNIETITGSSSKGGSEAIRNIIKSLKSGISIGMTPDGPRGPRMKVNSAIIKIASLTGHKIVPLSYSVKKKFFLNSWDKFLVALPFGKGCFVWGKPIKIKKNISTNEDLKLSKRLENNLLKLTKKADRYCN